MPDGNLNKPLSTQIEPIESLRDSDQRQMLELMQTYYQGVRTDTFQLDLAEKQWVITLRKSSGEICGFSTQVILPVPGKPDSLALFSGDTIIADAFRGTNGLAGMWGRFALEQLDRFPEKRLYWFLISKGYKTYRYLPLFFRDYYPQQGCAMPTDIAAMIDALASWKFGNRYDSDRRIVQGDVDSCRLRDGVAPIVSHRLKDPHIAYFVNANPGHVLGDELCCLAPITHENFTSVAYRVIEAARQLELR
jgi:hypothetical protein